MEYLDLTVRPDWQQVRWQRAMQRIQQWRFIKIIVITSTLIQGIWILWGQPAAWWDLVQLLLGPALLGGVVAWHVLQARRHRVRSILIVGAVLILESMIVYFTQPTIARDLVSEPWSHVLVTGSIVLPIINGLVLRLVAEPEQRILQQLGCHFERWSIYLLIGLATGGALGFHLFLTLSPMLEFPAFSASLLFVGFWTFAVQLGFRTLFEELLFRGLSYTVYVEGSNGKFWWTALKIALLNTCIHLGLVLRAAPSIGAGLGWLGYQMILSLVNLVLFQQTRSLLPCILSGVVFSLFIALAWQ